MSKPALRIVQRLAVGLVLVGLIVFAAELYAAERQRAYSYRNFTSITPHDTNITIKGCRWIQVTVAGNVVFNQRDATQSAAYPMVAYSTFELGWDHVGIHTSTTATGIFCFWDLDTASVPLS